MPEVPRDPKFNPDEGDVFRKFGVLVRVEQVIGGCVYTNPRLSSKDWLGIQFFREWVKDAEVVTETES